MNNHMPNNAVLTLSVLRDARGEKTQQARTQPCVGIGVCKQRVPFAKRIDEVSEAFAGFVGHERVDVVARALVAIKDVGIGNLAALSRLSIRSA